MKESYHLLFLQKAVTIRGIGENEVALILEKEFERLPKKTRATFRESQ